MQKMQPYYLDQQGWSSNDYYSLHRYLHRLITHADRKRGEIESLDTTQMSEKTKVLLYCIISYYHMNDLFKLANLESLANQQPLSEPLILSGHGMKEENVYYRMNVMF